MRAIRVHEFGEPSVLRLEEVPTPEPGQGEVLIQVKAIGVNPAETYVRTGRYAMLPPLPYTPGSDGAGVITKLGPGVVGAAAGDRVYFFGTAAGRGVGSYAEFASAAANRLHRLPERVSFAQGAAIGVPYATAHRALLGRAAARSGETVFIHGASGGVGTAAVQIARWQGLTVIGTAGTPEGAEVVRKLGAHHVVNHREAGYLDRVRELTNGVGPAIILEMLANVNLDLDLGLIAKGGRVVVIGNRGRIEIDPRQTMSKDSTILGMSLWNASDAELDAIYADLGRGLESGALVPVIGHELPLGEAARAHELVMSPGARGKVVLIP